MYMKKYMKKKQKAFFGNISPVALLMFFIWFVNILLFAIVPHDKVLRLKVVSGYFLRFYTVTGIFMTIYVLVDELASVRAKQVVWIHVVEMVIVTVLCAVTSNVFMNN